MDCHENCQVSNFVLSILIQKSSLLRTRTQPRFGLFPALLRNLHLLLHFSKEMLLDATQTNFHVNLYLALSYSFFDFTFRPSITTFDMLLQIQTPVPRSGHLCCWANRFAFAESGQPSICVLADILSKVSAVCRCIGGRLRHAQRVQYQRF